MRPFFRSLAFCGCLLAVTAAFAQGAAAAGGILATNAVNAGEVWFSTNTTGANLGTITAPFYGSPYWVFDSKLNSLPANTVIHLMAGTYLTYGDNYSQRLTNGFELKNGQHLVGAGMNKTILKNIAPDYPSISAIVGTSYDTSDNFTKDQTLPGNDDILVSDMTVNCGGINQRGGINLRGQNQRVERVRFTGQRSTSETFSVLIIDAPLVFGVTNAPGNAVINCVVDGFDNSGGGMMTCFNLIGTLTNSEPAFSTMGDVVCGNFISDTNPSAIIAAFNVGGSRNVVFSHNSVFTCGITYAVYGDSWYGRNITIANNVFQTGWGSAVRLFNGPAYNDVKILGNSFTMTAAANNVGWHDNLIYLDHATNVLMADNVFRAPNFAGTVYVRLNNGSTLFLKNNSFPAATNVWGVAVANAVDASSKLVATGNVDFYGNPIFATGIYANDGGGLTNLNAANLSGSASLDSISFPQLSAIPSWVTNGSGINITNWVQLNLNGVPILVATNCNPPYGWLKKTLFP